jgi:xanthine dehydrogenase YagR molybdenum-binding subunit
VNTAEIPLPNKLHRRQVANPQGSCHAKIKFNKFLGQTVYDPRNGHAVNDNFADYRVATSADTPDIDVSFLDIPDPLMGEYGARGIGEIGLAGVASAITSAVYHATGIRVREQPVRIEDLLTARV